MDGPGSVSKSVSGGSNVKRFLFAVAVACLFAATAPADPPVTTTAPPPVVTGTVLAPTTAQPGRVMTTSGTTSTRRMGLIGRLRNRSSAPAYSAAPVTTGTVITQPAITTPGTTVPVPM